MKKLLIIGLLILFLGIGMLGFGVSMFTYQGDHLSPFLSQVGEYCFFLWGPVVVIGIVVFIIAALSNNGKSKKLPDQF